MRRLRFVPLAFGLCFGFVAIANAQHAHVHGVARLDAAVDGGTIELVLTAPKQDLVGFERAPRSDAEKAQLLDARKRVLDHARLWRFNAAARCLAETPVLLEGGDGMGDASGHAHDHDHAHDGDAAHADWVIRYRFRCAAPQALQAIDTGLFDSFPALRSIEVQRLDRRGAQGLVLGPAQPRLPVTP